MVTTSRLRPNLERETARLRDPVAALLSLRGVLDKGNYSTLLQTLGNRGMRRLRKQVFPTAQVTSRPSYLLPSVGLEREMRWARLYLGLFADDLVRYVRWRRVFERSLLLGHRARALGALDRIENETGQSTWVVRQRISSIQLFEGIDGQKRYALDVQAQTPSSLVAIVARAASLRAEGAVTYDRFSSQFTSMLDDMGVTPAMRLYFEELFLPSLDPSEDKLLAVLSVESARSVVDYYEAVLRACQAFVGWERRGLADPATKREVAQIAERFASKMEDGRWNRLQFELAGRSASATLEVEPLEPFHLLLRQDYATALGSARQELRRQPSLYGTAEVAARSVAADPSLGAGMEATSLIEEITLDLADVYGKVDDASRSAMALWKTSAIWFDFGWGRALAGTMLPENPSGSPRESHSPAPSPEAHSSLTGLEAVHPLHTARVQTADGRTLYSHLVAEAAPGSLGALYARTIAEPVEASSLEVLGDKERLLLQVEAALVRRSYSEALMYSDALISSLAPRYSQAGYRYKAWTLLHMDAIGECAELVAAVLVNNPELRAAFPLGPVASVTAEADAGSPLSRAILFDLHSRFLGDTFLVQKAWALEEVLRECGATKPSLLTKCFSGDEQALIYVLRFVCEEDTLGHLLTLEDSTRAVEDERVAILRSLATLDPVRAAEYGKESARLLQQMDLQHQRQEVERSRVYVNVEGVQREVMKLEDSYDRYITYLEKDFFQPLQRELDRARQRKDEGEDSPAIILLKGGSNVSDPSRPHQDREGVRVIHLPHNELDSLLFYLVKSIRDEYVSNTQHGLDGYLSMRIRHGTLKGEMRSAIEKHRLITQVDSETGRYKSNDYWLDRINAQYDTRLDLDNAFSKFSESYDDFVENMKSQWIQVKRYAKEPGLFDFSFSEDDLDEILSQHGIPPPPFEDFVEGILTLMGNKLERSLANVRRSLDEKAKQTATQLLRELQAAIENSPTPPYLANDLLNEIQSARTAVLDTITNVSTWFDSPGEEQKGTFSLEGSIRLAERHVAASVPGFSVEVVGATGIALLGPSPSCFDILFNIFDNAAKRSGHPEGVSAEVRVAVRERDLEVAVSNPVLDSVLTDETFRHVDEIQRAVERDTFDNRVAQEGGTGLQKIANALARDFASETAAPSLTFGFEEGPSFIIRLRFPLELVECGAAAARLTS